MNEFKVGDLVKVEHCNAFACRKGYKEIIVGRVTFIASDLMFPYGVTFGKINCAFKAHELSHISEEEKVFYDFRMPYEI